MNTNRVFIKGTFLGLALGLAFTLGIVVSAAWADPTSEPPTGGIFRVSTGTQAVADCNETHEYGSLEYNATTDDLRLCTDGNTWVDVGP